MKINFYKPLRTEPVFGMEQMKNSLREKGKQKDSVSEKQKKKDAAKKKGKLGPGNVDFKV